MYCRAHKTATLTPIQHTVIKGLLVERNYTFLGFFRACFFEICKFCLQTKFSGQNRMGFSNLNVLHTVKNTTFHGEIFPMHFGYLITVPSTVDKWYFQLYFGKKDFISYRL